MTLNLTIINSHGAWQCSDHRLTEPGSSHLTDDWSAKHVGMICRDGSLLVTYSGLGQVKGITVSDWARELLRGEYRTVDESLIELREAATTDLGPLAQGRYLHMFTATAFLGGVPWLCQVRNFSLADDGSLTMPGSTFETHAVPAPGGAYAVFGAGHAVAKSDYDLLQKVQGRRPRLPEHFSTLLAEINHRTAARDAKKTVSHHCTTAYLSPIDGQIATRLHAPNTLGGKGLADPFLLRGIDFTDQILTLREAVMCDIAGNPQTDAERAARSAAAFRNATVPRNRLRRSS